MRRLAGSPLSAARMMPSAVLIRSSRSSELVMKSPKLLSPVLFAETGHLRVLGRIAVFHPLLGFLPSACAQVRTNVGFGAHQSGVIEKLMRAEAITFDGTPSHFQTWRALVSRADAVLP